jgi:hypothetical protein
MKCVGHKNVPHDYIECLTDLEPLMVLNAEGEGENGWSGQPMLRRCYCTGIISYNASRYKVCTQTYGEEIKEKDRKEQGRTNSACAKVQVKLDK